MTANEITAEVRRLFLSNRPPVLAELPRLERIARDLEDSGIRVRVGGYSKSSRKSTSYVYVTIPGQPEKRVWECVTKDAGTSIPVGSLDFGRLLYTLDKEARLFRDEQAAAAGRLG